MNENESLSPQTRIENLIKKLETPQITLLQIKSLFFEYRELIDDINKEYYEKYQKEKKEADKEEVEAINKLAKEFNQKFDTKLFSFVDKWETKGFTPNDREVEYLQTILTTIWQKKEQLRLGKEDEAYQKNDKYTEKVDKFEEDNELAFSHHDKLLFLIAQYYKDQQQTSSTSSDQKKKNPTILPWTLAIIFGIMTIILAGIAGFLFYKQRKIKRFKV